MSTTRRGPVMAEVAEHAGVSVMTVSRVLNDRPNVTPATRERVAASIAALGYRANVAARTLAGGRSRLLGVISVQPESWGPSRTVFGVEAAAQNAGHAVSFTTVRDPSPAALSEAINGLLDLHADGIVLVARVRSATDALAELDIGVPVVVTYPIGSGVHAVGIDQRHGALLATRHLLELGHERVDHVRGPKGWIDADHRADGWRSELRRRRRGGQTIIGDWTPQSGYEAGQKLAADRSTTAVFVANDQMALGLMLALHEAGRSVPDDVSIVGFDDVPESGFYLPPLTTVRQDFGALGRRSVAALLEIIDGGRPEATTIEPELVIRRSTARPV